MGQQKFPNPSQRRPSLEINLSRLQHSCWLRSNHLSTGKNFRKNQSHNQVKSQIRGSHFGILLWWKVTIFPWVICYSVLQHLNESQSWSKTKRSKDCRLKAWSTGLRLEPPNCQYSIKLWKRTKRCHRWNVRLALWWNRQGMRHAWKGRLLGN